LEDLAGKPPVTKYDWDPDSKAPHDFYIGRLLTGTTRAVQAIKAQFQGATFQTHGDRIVLPLMDPHFYVTKAKSDIKHDLRTLKRTRREVSNRLPVTIEEGQVRPEKDSVSLELAVAGSLKVLKGDATCWASLQSGKNDGYHIPAN